MAFFEIFSDKKLKEKKKDELRIIADNREKNSLVIPELIKLGVEVKREQLEVADFIVGAIAIERKTASDFVSSMMNKRLIRQLEEMQQYEKNLLIVEGELGDLYPSKNLENPLRGMLLSIVLKYNVPIIFSRNSEETARFIYLLAKREEKSEIGIRAKRRLLTDEEKAQFVLEGFGGIGPAMAKKLLKKYKTLRKIFSLSKEELESEIGKKAQTFELLDNQFQ